MCRNSGSNSRLKLSLQWQDPRFEPPLLRSGSGHLQEVMHHTSRLSMLYSGDASLFPWMVGGIQKTGLRHLTFRLQKTGRKPRLSSQEIGSLRAQEQEQTLAEAVSGEVDRASPWAQLKAAVLFCGLEECGDPGHIQSPVVPAAFLPPWLSWNV